MFVASLIAFAIVFGYICLAIHHFYILLIGEPYKNKGWAMLGLGFTIIMFVFILYILTFTGYGFK